MEIPQNMIAKHHRNAATIRKDDSITGSNSNKAKRKRRQDARSIAITQVQGMVWLHPTKSPLEALDIMEQGPPRIPELDMEGYKATVAIRDFPIDWTVLMENIMGEFSYN